MFFLKSTHTIQVKRVTLVNPNPTHFTMGQVCLTHDQPTKDVGWVRRVKYRLGAGRVGDFAPLTHASFHWDLISNGILKLVRRSFWSGPPDNKVIVSINIPNSKPTFLSKKKPTPYT